ncbi:hypothetical protein FGO68_gene10711 [Halteria grandinella]|uniref:Uncharacterized protein n=1 Tax=Halteria grandinella TaxID=5974 RepID=A0A8J8NTW3_HALGN|nr:hypothetical protein FGO68_gene10711 [Halteria grandinella]
MQSSVLSFQNCQQSPLYASKESNCVVNYAEEEDSIQILKGHQEDVLEKLEDMFIGSTGNNNQFIVEHYCRIDLPSEDNVLLEVKSPYYQQQINANFCEGLYKENSESDPDHLNEDLTLDVEEENVNFTTLQGIRFMPSLFQKQAQLFSTQPIQHPVCIALNTVHKASGVEHFQIVRQEEEFDDKNINLKEGYFNCTQKIQANARLQKSSLIQNEDKVQQNCIKQLSGFADSQCFQNCLVHSPANLDHSYSAHNQYEMHSSSKHLEDSYGLQQPSAENQESDLFVLNAQHNHNRAIQRGSISQPIQYINPAWVLLGRKAYDDLEISTKRLQSHDQSQMEEENNLGILSKVLQPSICRFENVEELQISSSIEIVFNYLSGNSSPPHIFDKNEQTWIIEGNCQKQVKQVKQNKQANDLQFGVNAHDDKKTSLVETHKIKLQDKQSLKESRKPDLSGLLSKNLIFSGCIIPSSESISGEDNSFLEDVIHQCRQIQQTEESPCEISAVVGEDPGESKINNIQRFEQKNEMYLNYESRFKSKAVDNRTNNKVFQYCNLQDDEISPQVDLMGESEEFHYSKGESKLKQSRVPPTQPIILKTAREYVATQAEKNAFQMYKSTKILMQ